MTELWTNTFIPWIVNVLNSSVDLQFIMDGYSCAAYIVGYVNKSNYGVSNLRRQLVQLQADHPELDFVGLMKKVCINMLNSIEMSCQEADWYLLRQPISEASCEVVFVPTMWASNRVKSHKKRERMDAEGLDAECEHTEITDGMHFLQPYDKHCKVIVAKFGQNVEAVDAVQDRTVEAQATVTANNDDIQIL
ncbi:unnamed protein product [Ixodes persulcatus]